MIGYARLGVNDLERSVPFYDALLTKLGAEQCPANDRTVIWRKFDQPMLGICLPKDGQSKADGNGTMIAFPLETRDDVDDLEQVAHTLAAPYIAHSEPEKCQGFYAIFLRDFDNNELCFYSS